MITTAALFVALLFLDLFRQEYELLAGHTLFGILATLLMMLLCQKGATMAAWGLLALPFVLLILGWMIGVLRKEDARLVPYRPAAPVNPCRRCQPKPCRCTPWLGPGGTQQRPRYPSSGGSSSGGSSSGSSSSSANIIPDITPSKDLLGPGGTRQLLGPGGTRQLLGPGGTQWI